MNTQIEVKEYDLFLGGKFVRTNDIREIKNPFNGETIARVSFADRKMYEQAVGFAHSAFEKTRKLPTYAREKILHNIADYMEEHLEEISLTLACEAAKPISQARAETGRCIHTFRVAAEESKRMIGEVIPLDCTEIAKNHTGFTRRFPIGVVAGITPFNFPLNLASHKVGPAIAAGNPIILKPSSATPVSALWIARAAYESGLPEGGLQVLPADPDNTEPMISDERVKYITFTGSASVGWALKNRSGKKRIALELGGNAGVIIDKDANIDYAAERCFPGAFAYAGQICISIQRIFIHNDVYDRFTEKFVNLVREKGAPGHPLDPGVIMSSMINEKEARRVEAWVEEAEAQGAVALCRGKRHGSVMEPVVLANTTPDMKVCSEEIFGPVAILDRFSNFDEAAAKVNNSRYGLQAGVFTNSLDNAMKAYEEIETGAVIINDIPTFRIDHMPYGGVKDSGLGREGLKYAIEEMTETKLMVLNRIEGN
ncbi:MAG: aldehyde dehydrogenase family protein [Firmicutes bacterium]|nr:aldehyde dehydrogenase family protein [Bacillota bacterium]